MMRPVPETKPRTRPPRRRELAEGWSWRRFRFRGGGSGVSGPASRASRRLFRLTGTLAGLLGMFLLLGGHWMLLQSVAWSRMLMDFSRQDSLAQAVSKTFDGRHPCSLCRQIVQGRQQEQDEQRRRPLLASDKLPELLSAGTTATAPLPSADPVRMLVQVAALKPQTSLPPPKPPPRGSC